MSMSRVSFTSEVFEQSSSPLIISHGSFVGLGISLSNEGADLLVEADLTQESDFENEVEMLGGATEDSSGAATKFRYPSTTGLNLLYAAKYLQITWDTGTLQYFQKG